MVRLAITAGFALTAALDLKCDAVHHSPATGPVRTAPQQGEDAA
jgi:hypothetical protein